jgi:hypothetical protein
MESEPPVICMGSANSTVYLMTKDRNVTTNIMVFAPHSPVRGTRGYLQVLVPGYHSYISCNSSPSASPSASTQHRGTCTAVRGRERSESGSSRRPCRGTVSLCLILSL